MVADRCAIALNAVGASVEADLCLGNLRRWSAKQAEAADCCSNSQHFIRAKAYLTPNLGCLECVFKIADHIQLAANPRA